MKKIAVCGDSFASVSKIIPGTHFSELIAKDLRCDLLNLARRGCSNGGIRLQITEAIKQKADFVIVVATSFDRMELPVDDRFFIHSESSLIKEFGNFLQDFLLNKSKSSYDPSMGVKNINYDPLANNKMIFETIFSLAENYDHEYRKTKLTKEKVVALKHFINHLYDPAWKQQIDKWIIVSGICELYDKNIPFSLDSGMLWDDLNNFRKDIPSFIPKHFIREGNELVGTGTNLFPLINKNKDPGYHSEPEGQIWVADLYKRLIKDVYNL